LGKDKVSFSLTAAIAVVDFIVMGDLICVSALSNVTNSGEVEKALVDKYMKPKQLIKASSLGLANVKLAFCVDFNCKI
jgi:hypothetical protein